MKLEFGKSWAKKLQGRIEMYEFDVGVLDDKPHKNPVVHGRFEEPQLGSYAGGPVRKTSREESGVSISDVLIENQERLNINLLLRPFQEQGSDLIKFTTYFLRYVAEVKGSSIRRVENLLQAVVRNPILNQEYGQNNASTADAKGFDRHLIDTGQTFKAIKARARRV